MISHDRCYRGARGTRVCGISAHNGYGPSDISGPLLPPHIVATGYMASDDHCCCWGCGTRMVATGVYSSDMSSDISGPLLLPPTIATGYMTSDDRCYCGARGTRAVSTRPTSAIGCPILANLNTTIHSGDGLHDFCYYWARGTHTVATSPHSNDERSGIGGPSLLASTVATG
jgi:hypothetical protein